MATLATLPASGSGPERCAGFGKRDDSAEPGNHALLPRIRGSYRRRRPVRHRCRRCSGSLTGEHRVPHPLLVPRPEARTFVVKFLTAPPDGNLHEVRLAADPSDANGAYFRVRPKDRYAIYLRTTVPAHWRSACSSTAST